MSGGAACSPAGMGRAVAARRRPILGVGPARLNCDPWKLPAGLLTRGGRWGLPGPSPVVPAPRAVLLGGVFAPVGL